MDLHNLKTDEEAIDYAADREATCYRLYDDGHKEEIYNPRKEGGL